MTPYQQKILDKINKTLEKHDINTIAGAAILTLLVAIEERDKLLQKYYHFFGPGSKEAHKIAQVLETP